MPTTHDPDDPDLIFSTAAGAPGGDGDDRVDEPTVSSGYPDETEPASADTDEPTVSSVYATEATSSSVYATEATSSSVYAAEPTPASADTDAPTSSSVYGAEATPDPAEETTAGSVYPDGAGGGGFLERHTGATPAWGSPRLPASSGQIFERRAPTHGPQPDEYGYYPDDYYLPTDWPRLITKSVLGLAVALMLTIAGFELYDRYSPTRVDDETEAEPTPTPIQLVEVFECAGDTEPVARREPPGQLLIAGRTADSRWLAFRNPEAPPLQLWVLASDIPGFDASTVGLVSCADSPDAFPTPFGTGAG